MYANKIAYYDDDTYATRDAMNIGRLHCYVQSWKDASVDFLLSGGFVVSDKVPKVQQDTLLLWGSKDAIISPTTADKFVTVMPRCELTWVEECGHVPHLEQPSFTAQQITQFLKQVKPSSSSSSSSSSLVDQWTSGRECEHEEWVYWCMDGNGQQ